MRFNKPLLAVSLLLSLTTLTAEASLTVGVSDGKSVVYDNVTNITWTSDANLLGTLESTLGFNTAVNAIIAASPTINDMANDYDTPANSGHHSVTTSDFSSGGYVSWFGAQAFSSYLNSISYAGSKQWALPTDNGSAIVNISNFTNVHTGAYWFDTEVVNNPNLAWYFYGSGNLDNGGKGYYKLYAWAGSPGNVTAVPVPGGIWLFSSAIVGLIGFAKRK